MAKLRLDLDEISREDDKINSALGILVRRWVDLHEELGEIFVQVLGISREVAFAMWHSARADTAQRVLLLTAVKATLKMVKRGAPSHVTIQHLTAYEEALKDIDKLARTRNDFVHSAIVYLALDDTGVSAMVNPFTFNPRAMSTKNKDVLETCTSAHRYISQVKAYLSSLRRMRSNEPFPDKPQLPDL